VVVRCQRKLAIWYKQEKLKKKENRMSWSFSALGKPEAVARKAEEDLAKLTYLTGDEAELKDMVKAIILKAAACYTGGKGYALNIQASGHATTSGETKQQTISLTISPYYGLVE
jgi:hypothetical protein